MTDSPSPMTVADVLNAAADLLEPEGRWTQGAYARKADGTELQTPLAKSATCYCMFGAMAVACRTNPENGGNAKYSKAVTAVLDSLRISSIDFWNDRPARTQAEVVHALREAARTALSKANGAEG